MNSSETIKLFAHIVFPRAVHLHGLATAGAILTCVAVALNVGPFAKIPTINSAAGNAGGDAMRSIGELDIVSSIPGRFLETPTPLDDPQPELNAAPQPALHVAETVAPITPMDALPISAVEAAAAAASQALEPKHGEREESAPAATGAADVMTHQAEDANSDPVKNATIVGVWAPNAGTCSARDFREGALPAVISTDGAWAGETFCMFSNKKPTETGWNVIAKCSSPKERWTANVRLTVKDNRLTWTSKRDTQAYTRCAPDVLMAAAR